MRNCLLATLCQRMGEWVIAIVVERLLVRKDQMMDFVRYAVVSMAFRTQCVQQCAAMVPDDSQRIALEIIEAIESEFARVKLNDQVQRLWGVQLHGRTVAVGVTCLAGFMAYHALP